MIDCTMSYFFCNGINKLARMQDPNDVLEIYITKQDSGISSTYFVKFYIVVLSRYLEFIRFTVRQTAENSLNDFQGQILKAHADRIKGLFHGIGN